MTDIKQEYVTGMQFSEHEVADGFIEVRVRLPATDGKTVGTLEGNAARKMFITWVLATASGLFGTKPGDALDVMFHEVALTHHASADLEQAQWQSQRAHQS